MRPGGVYDYRGNQRSVEIKGLVRFAVQEHNKKKIYEAKIWVKLWINFKQLQEFKHAEHGLFSSLSNLNAVKDCAKFELHLKLRRGSEGERHWVEIIKNSEGKFYLK
ncbi:hypothetical protein CISIN_1g046245mg [Citrus sinensis]|uniref:Cysteine proteinase inhibitor n=1 Tax=Citrus sinensis TaxID=2711 RepID=A0A067DJT1_CITSI|nr:hypothetical protein CISIN_1g046245mg [Citrus sinensis]